MRKDEFSKEKKVGRRPGEGEKAQNFWRKQKRNMTKFSIVYFSPPLSATSDWWILAFFFFKLILNDSNLIVQEHTVHTTHFSWC